MPTVVMANVGAHGHINPTLPVAGELVRRGARVVYFAPEEYRAQITALGVDFVPYASVFGKAPPAPGTPPEVLMAMMPARLTGECLATLPQLEPKLREIKPDVIIYDKFCLSARLLARELGIKAAVFLPSYASNEKWSLHRVFAGDVTPPKDHPALAQFRAEADRLEQRFGVKLSGIQDLLGVVEPLNICFVARAFQYESEAFDDRFVFVGPAVAPRPAAGDWRPQSGEGRSLVFVSLGTVFNAWPEFFKLSFAAFRGAPYHVLMAIGDRVDRAALGQPPENCELAPHVPQLQVLEHARVFVTHGGMNSTMEALWFGVPMVVIPQMVEQAATAKRVEALGLGQAFTREQVTPQALREAVDRLAEDQATRARVREMRDKVRAGGGQAEAADAILRYAKKS